MQKKSSAKEGDRVEVELISDGSRINGVVYPSNEKNSLVLKMNSGYNVGFELKNIKKIKVLGKGKGKVAPYDVDLCL